MTYALGLGRGRPRPGGADRALRVRPDRRGLRARPGVAAAAGRDRPRHVRPGDSVEWGRRARRAPRGGGRESPLSRVPAPAHDRPAVPPGARDVARLGALRGLRPASGSRAVAGRGSRRARPGRAGPSRPGSAARRRGRPRNPRITHHIAQRQSGTGSFGIRPASSPWCPLRPGAARRAGSPAPRSPRSRGRRSRSPGSRAAGAAARPPRARRRSRAARRRRAGCRRACRARCLRISAKPLGVDRQADDLRRVDLEQRRRRLDALHHGHVRGLVAEVAEVHRERRLRGARDADEDEVGLVQAGRRRRRRT